MTIAYGALAVGLGSERTATHRKIFLNNSDVYLPGGKQINGTLSRDSGNTPITVLRPGLLMGKITATGLYAPSILGVSTGAYTSGGTSITVSAAQATEIVRRVGATGNLIFVGPPTANGTNAVSAAKAYSAINTTTGVITTADIGADKVAGSFVIAEDGSGIPRTFVPDNEYGIQVTDQDGTSVASVDFPRVPVAGNVDSSQLLYWPSDTSLMEWIVTSLNGTGGGQFVFDHKYA